MDEKALGDLVDRSVLPHFRENDNPGLTRFDKRPHLIDRGTLDESPLFRRAHVTAVHTDAWRMAEEQDGGLRRHVDVVRLQG
jgi:hypothetical protein